MTETCKYCYHILKDYFTFKYCDCQKWKDEYEGKIKNPFPDIFESMFPGLRKDKEENKNE